MKIVLTANSNEINKTKILIGAINGTIHAIKPTQIGFSDNSTLEIFCDIPKKNLHYIKNFYKGSRNNG